MLEIGLGSLDKSVGVLETRVSAFVNELKETRQQKLRLERELAKNEAGALLDKAEAVNGVKVLSASVTAGDQQVLREMADFLRDKLGSAVVVLGAVIGERPVFIATVTPDLVKKGYNAGDIIKQVSKVAGGGGGGKANFAQAGGKDISKLDEALNTVKSLIK